MGFPEWTLWGMGISALLALLSLALALLGQSPKFLMRSGLSGMRLDHQVRTFTAVAFACLLLAFGFFIAGVPLGEQATSTTVAQASDSPAPTLPDDSTVITELDNVPTKDAEEAIIITRATPATGAFDGPPVSTAATSEKENDESDGLPDPDQENGPTPSSSPTTQPTTTPTPTSSPAATITPTPPPTFTPTPSTTPTPVLDETIQVETQGSTVWLNRSPGGQNLVLVQDGEFLLILTGHANQGGILWREVRTLEGVSGWLQEEFLLVDGSDR